jgi:hypothetical protein
MRILKDFSPFCDRHHRQNKFWRPNATLLAPNPHWLAPFRRLGCAANVLEDHMDEAFSPRNSEPTTEKVRKHIRFSPDAIDAVEEIKRLAKLETFHDALRRAISDELFLLQKREQKWEVILQRGDETQKIVWPS